MTCVLCVWSAGQEELGLRAGDVVTMVEQVDDEWYRGTCRGSTGFFPINYVNVLVRPEAETVYSNCRYI